MDNEQKRRLIEALMKSGKSFKEEPYDPYTRFANVHGLRDDASFANYFDKGPAEGEEYDSDKIDEFLKRRKFKVLEQGND